MLYITNRLIFVCIIYLDIIKLLDEYEPDEC